MNNNFNKDLRHAVFVFKEFRSTIKKLTHESNIPQNEITELIDNLSHIND